MTIKITISVIVKGKYTIRYRVVKVIHRLDRLSEYIPTGQLFKHVYLNWNFKVEHEVQLFVDYEQVKHSSLQLEQV
jgi:hypothetical protein